MGSAFGTLEAREFGVKCHTAPGQLLVPAFDLSVQFNERDPAYADGHVRALAWRKVWQAIKEILKVFCLILKDSAFALNQFRPDITA